MFARTKRLVLRPGWAEDAFMLAEALDDEAVRGQLAAQAAGVATDPRLPDFLAFARTGGAPRLIGGAAILRRADGAPELSFWVARPFWGLGFATEAAGAVMRIARATRIGRVTATTLADNRAAARVLSKIGFQATGRTEHRRIGAAGDPLRCALFEDADQVPMCDDVAAELYEDCSPLIAA